MVLKVCATALIESQILDIHRQSGHLGRRRIVYFVVRVSPSKSKIAIISVIKSCMECQIRRWCTEEVGNRM